MFNIDPGTKRKQTHRDIVPFITIRLISKALVKSRLKTVDSVSNWFSRVLFSV